jgi:hypothetical protein
MRLYKTGELAKLFKVAPRTINKWIDSGKLQGYRLPACGANPTQGDRRVSHQAVMNFIAEQNLPLPDGLRMEFGEILFFRCAELRALLPDERPGIRAVQSAIECGALIARLHPFLVIVGSDVPRDEVVAIKALVKEDSGKVIRIARTEMDPVAGVKDYRPTVDDSAVWGLEFLGQFSQSYRLLAPAPVTLDA